MTGMLKGIAARLHLWVGVPLAIYAVLIGLSGAVLVFREDIQASLHPQLHTGAPARFGADPDRVLKQIQERYPGWRPLTFTWPHDRTPYWMIFLLKGNQSRELYVDPQTGQFVAEVDPHAGWFGWTERLHNNLHWGRNGRLANGYGALGVLLLSVTGLQLFWPRRRSLATLWQRDGWRFWHYTLGLASLVGLVALAFTGAYYTWSKYYIAAVSQVLPRTPELTLPPLPAPPPPPPTVWRLMDIAQQALPGKAIQRFPIPDARFPLRVTFREGSFAEFQLVSSVTLDPRTGAVLRVQRLAERPAGDGVLGWINGLHFGAFWGRLGQVLWAFCGVSLAILGPTGVWIWWRRRQVSLKG